ncbi:MAG: hypothetical protein ACKOJF_09735, partial [Planctomycetaceae bacterium]
MVAEAAAQGQSAGSPQLSQPDEAAARPRPVAAVTNPRAMRPQRPARGVQPAGGHAPTAAARPGTPAAPQPSAGSRSA